MAASADQAGPPGSFDYIVVGAGTAGCVLANRLSADPGSPGPAARGRRQGQPSLDPHPGRLSLHPEQSAHRLVLQDRARGRARRARAQLSARQGAGRLLVDQRHDLHARPGGRLRPLAPAGPRRAGAGTTCCPTSSARRTTSTAPTTMHGAGGEWRVEEQRLSWEILDAFRAAAAEVGIPPTDDFNRGDNEGCGYFQVNQRRGVRWSTAKAFLRPARARPEPDRADPRRRRPGSRSTAGARWACTFATRAGDAYAAVAGRGGPRERRDRLAAAAAALRHRPGRAAGGAAASRWCTSSRRSAPTCRTTCSCG